MLHVHRAERADLLVDALAAVVAEPFDDPLAPETVAVPTRGVERWLTQRLSATLGASPDRGDGVCANIDFPFPGRLVGRAMAGAVGVDREADPWLPERLVWPILDVVGARMEQVELAALAAHLGGDGKDPDQGRTARRFATLRRIADLFDRYGVHRPAMVAAWADGENVDAHGEPLPPDVAWQAQLWRWVREQVGVPSPAERLTQACARLRDEPQVTDLPARLSLFGLTRLPASYLDVLDALAGHRDVHLFLLHPSPELWQHVGGHALPAQLMPRRDDPTAELPANPLLSTWGRDAREMQIVLTARDAGRAEHHYPLGDEPTTLLGHLQADVRADRTPPGTPLPGERDRRHVLDPEDRSVAVHACHGRARQVEVLREAILHLLADDPTLEPRDIIVMCPDIDAFAPLIHATFGAGEVEEADDEDLPADRRPPDLRVRLADRSLRQTNPVLGAISELLSLATARLTASEVVDFASREPVRRRFGFDDDDLARIEEWVADTGIRWGLDADHRAPYKLDTLPANTWATGLDRLLLGVAMDEDGQRLVGGTLPLDDVASGDIALSGRLAELVDRLGEAVAALGRVQPLEQWVQALAGAADALTATSEREGWQRAQLRRLLDDVTSEATTGDEPNATPLGLTEVRSLLAERLRGRPTRANFRTGHLTMCTLVPMRSVPHRVVCLLGLDDEVFPRQTVADGDDLIARAPCVGDRDPRSEDRQLLLDALLAAREHLVVTFTGRDERTNAIKPPAVPLGELLDVVDATARSSESADEDGCAARDRVLVHHPLHHFDARNFTPGELVPARAWSFDPVALDGAKASAGQRRPARAFLAAPLPPDERDFIELDDLVRFVHHPVRSFLRQRLGIVLGDRDQTTSDALPIEIDKLEEWGVGNRLLQARLTGADMASCRRAEAARQQLPPAELGIPVLDRVAPVVDRIAAAAGQFVDPDTEPESVEVRIDVGGGRLLAGSVAQVHGDLLRPAIYSRVAAKHRLAAWVRLLALTAAHPDRPFATATVGRGDKGTVALARLPALGADAERRHAVATSALAAVLDVYLRGMCEPLPLYCATSAAYAEARAAGRNAESAARGQWTSGWAKNQRWSREDEELEHQLVLGGVRSFDQILEQPPRDDESGPGWAPDEGTRFGRYARRLWGPLLAHEELERR